MQGENARPPVAAAAPGQRDALPASPKWSPRTLIERWGQWRGRGKASAPSMPAPLAPREAERLRTMLAPCFQARLTDVAAQRGAQAWVDAYRQADPDRRHELLQVLAEVGGLHGADGHALFFKRLNALPDGLPFLLALRADILPRRAKIAGLRELDTSLEGQLSNWFDVGLLELRRMTWDSPASLLEKLMTYEAVHEVASWADMRNRLDADRRCYAFFHPRMPQEPLIFVEVALCADMAGDVQSLLDVEAPLEDLDKARWAIFYSISNTQAGLRGVSFGNFLLKRVIEELNRELPRIRSFATLSPIPGFNDWLAKRGADEVERILGSRAKRADGLAAPTGAELLRELLAACDAEQGEDALRETAFRLAAHYLVNERDRKLPLDSVARFHLCNGARIERLNWAADTSPKGRAQSCSMMVNYLYELDALDDNLARLGEGHAQTSRAIARLL